jgi:hypothetical protein
LDKMLGWTLKKQDGVVWTGLKGPVEGSCEHGNEPSGSLKCWEIREWLSEWRLLNKHSAP